MVKEIKKFFTWSDAWVFTALYYSVNNENTIDLGAIIVAGDALNHAILSDNELKTALLKLQQRGIIEIYEDRIKFTELGNSIIEKAEKTRGGLFSRVNISLQKLNSNRNRFPFVEKINDCRFITKENVMKSYQDYLRMFKGTYNSVE